MTSYLRAGALVAALGLAAALPAVAQQASPDPATSTPRATSGVNTPSSTMAEPRQADTAASPDAAASPETTTGTSGTMAPSASESPTAGSEASKALGTGPASASGTDATPPGTKEPGLGQAAPAPKQ